MLKRFLLALVLVALPLASAVGWAQRRHAGVDVASLDRTADPCTDFYQFACGGWMAHNPIPADRSSWGQLAQLQERNNEQLHAILDAAAAGHDADPDTRKIGDYYASCMDEPSIDRKGASPLDAELTRIDGMQSAADLPAVLAALHESGVNAFFHFGARPDYEDAAVQIAFLAPGGLGLPDRDFYFRPDSKSGSIRDAYTGHVAKMAELLGLEAARAQADAATVMRIETALAKAQLDVVARREPKNTNHKMKVAELQALAPHFGWAKYFAAVHAPAFDVINVSQPEAVKAVDEALATLPIADLRAYLRWRVESAAAPMLPKPFVDENFRFYGTTLNGTAELSPRWKRCVEYTDRDLGEALGKAFVKEAFGPQAKADTLKMVHEIESALERDIDTIDWMTAPTKKQAVAKLHAVADKIGYPDKWRDYSALTIVRGDAFGNLQRAVAFAIHRNVDKIGKPTDRSEWSMTPPTVNAYYSPQQNNINFPAGILQPPLYTPGGDPAANYGAAGSVIGHELTHGFDDQGRKYDGQGNLHEWWTAEDGTAFEQRASCIVDEYSSFVAVDDVHLNGKLTLGENTADNGGVRLALAAYLGSIVGQEAKAIDGFTPEQRFFLGWGQGWCENTRPERARVLAQTNPHSPGRYRVNGVLSNMPEFRKAFSCKADAPMVRENMCRVW